MTDAAAEVVDLCRDLIRLDTSNPLRPERAAAEHVAGLLAEVGLEPRITESEPGRASVVARWEGKDPSRPGLLIHGHLDVVPADSSEWSVDPFAAEVRDGFVWGRGAVDMKDMDAMTLAVVRDWLRQGRRPPRDVVLAFVADEEAGGRLGAGHLVNNHPDVFEGVSEAIGEVGGFSLTLPNQRRLYLLETAQKGMAWMRLRARGVPGHGMLLHDDNAVVVLAEAVARIGRHRFPLQPTPTVAALLEALADALGEPADADPESLVGRLGPLSRMIAPTLRHTANPTMLSAGYKVNVVPGLAEAQVDGRFLPGHEESFLATIDELLGGRVKREFVHHHSAVETGFDGDLVAAMTAALLCEDPAASVVPYMLAGGTDAKWFSRLGIRCFGFSPLRLPADLDFAAMYHGIDERVPIDALRFGVRVLDRFLASC